ncbi:putative ATP-dependent endonuclease of OLD family [Sphingomonas sp. SORGH_AS870]|uniref:ATP-dependent nuclease n=1 Tax=Sphingomonas sp. SORGH_AS_0870 TaxID=3041801 RepID=UPI002860629F|nr:ATP-binding protein [Sphingomonas sp. SORGH_AS_0870]MDR6144893.1 putative ATP-dependent endonuclease of OLD family [Sphingomonas sp. SORGH_AS_0870]
MPRIRQLRIERFRGIAQLEWQPSSGINGLIGPGDSGKSTILDAIDLLLSPRRSVTFSDADFHGLNTAAEIIIEAAVGDLPASLLDMERYGLFHRGWDSDLGVSDEPEAGGEIVLSVRLTVAADLDPRWTLYSERAEAEDCLRDLPYAERAGLAPTRLGAFASHHLAWGAKSVLNRIVDVRPAAAAALADAARQARATFGDAAAPEVADTIALVRGVAQQVGVSGAEEAAALLDAHGVGFGAGSIALHDGDGVPLRNLGIGSSRLLVAGLQALAGNSSPFTLVDELEHGLEPFRIIRLLHQLGAKDAEPPRQVFLTTHSPVVVRELSAQQLWRAGRDPASGKPALRKLGRSPEDQGALRSCADAFLAPSVLVCEGATEVGLLRGLDLYWTDRGERPIGSRGIALADGTGSNMLQRALSFARAGYRTGLLHDSDKELDADELHALETAGVARFYWDEPYTTEMQMFASIADDAIPHLVNLARGWNGTASVNDQIRARRPEIDLAFDDPFGYSAVERQALGAAATKGKWFKTVSYAETIGREVVGPFLAASNGRLVAAINELRDWIVDAAGAEPAS